MYHTSEGLDETACGASPQCILAAVSVLAVVGCSDKSDLVIRDLLT